MRHDYILSLIKQHQILMWSWEQFDKKNIIMRLEQLLLLSDVRCDHGGRNENKKKLKEKIYKESYMGTDNGGCWR